MTITVLFFANLRELAKTDSIDLDIGSANTVRDLLNMMRERLPEALTEALEDESAMVSVNQRYAGWDGTISDCDEVGFLPPVSGG